MIKALESKLDLTCNLKSMRQCHWR